jgi:MFS family permease
MRVKEIDRVAARRFFIFGEFFMLRNRVLLAVSFAVCASYTGIGMVVPVRVLYAESRGASLAIIGAMASSYLISNFLCQYPSGWLADRWGRKPMMMLSLLLQGVLSAVYLFVYDPVQFVALRFVEGAVAAAFLPSARALITDAIPPEKRGEAFGIFSAFFNVGFLLGPALGGFLAATGYASAFIGAVIFRLVALVIVGLTISDIKKSTTIEEPESERVSLRVLFTLPLIAAYILGFADFLYVGFDITLTPLWLHDHLGASVTLIGIAYIAWSIPSILVSPFSGRFADRHRRSLLILIFGLMQVPFYVAYGLANAALLVVGLFAIHSIVYSFMQPAVDAHLAAVSTSGARARIQGIYSACGTIGGFVGSTLSSYFYGINFRLPLFAIGAMFGLCALIGGLLVKAAENRRPTLKRGEIAEPVEIVVAQE